MWKAQMDVLSVSRSSLTNIYPTDKIPGVLILVRVLVGQVFLFEGIQKFLFPEMLGVGRFITIGIPFPEYMAPFVGIVEILGGLSVLIGLFTRLAAVPLIIDISVAIAATKIPMLFHRGFWVMMHEARVDFSMLLGLVFLLIVGGGRWSLQSLFANHRLVEKKE
jgi:putative oxidoreductase